MLDVETEYFVVAKSDDGKYSGMSNICKVKDIANQIPTGVTDGHGREYEGDSALDLPAYAEVEMLDGSLGEFLIEYHGAQVYHLQKPEEENEEVQVATDIKDTIFATSALGEWLAVNMLNHEETISLDGFNEASDSEYLSDVLLEAYNQNPLIGLLGTVNYDYKSNALLVEYELSEEETEHMQTESLKKAAEIASEITTEDMSDYEKEEAINRYLCENASYNDEIMSYISEDGTIDNDVTLEHANSFTPYGILCENVGVCESYAEAFLLIAKAAGLDAIVDSSVSKYVADGMDNEYYVKEGRYAEDLYSASKLLIEGLSREDGMYYYASGVLSLVKE